MDDSSALFQEAADFVQESVQLGDHAFESDEIKLKLYGLYKQSLFGPVQEPQPSIFYPKLRAKWNAWKNVAELTQEEAQMEYVQLVETQHPGWSSTGNGANDKTGPIFSRPVMESTEDGDTHPPFLSKSKRVLTLLMENEMDGERWREALKKSELEVDAVDEDLRTALHWAADEGNAEALEVLIRSGLDVHSQDNDLMTPLHYAALCEHQEVAAQLVAHGARWDVKDASGETPLDTAPASWQLEKGPFLSDISAERP